MRIAVVHNSSPGGADRLAAELARRLAREHDVGYGTWGDGPPIVPDGCEPLWQRPPPLHLPSPLHPFGDLFRSVVGSIRLGRIVDRGHYDVALVLACRWAQAPALLRTMRTPSVYFAQEGRRRSIEPGYRPSTRERRGVQRLAWWLGSSVYDAVGGALDRWALRGAPRILANSEGTADALRSGYGVQADVVHLGVDIDVFRWNGSAPSDFVLFVGALDPTKRPDLAIRALAAMPAARRPRLRIISNRASPSFLSKLERLASDDGVDLDVVLDATEDELVDSYQSALALIATATREPFGLTVLEAGACGCPTVAVDEGGFRITVAHGATGLICPATAEGLALALEELLDRPLDRSAIAAHTAATWSWSRCVASVGQALAEAVTHAHPPRYKGLSRSVSE